MLHAGQRVVCVDDRIYRNVHAYPNEMLPKRGMIYTVREIIPLRAVYGEDGLRLVEIVNRPRRYNSPRGWVTNELAFRIWRFRPVSATNIDVFLKMLEPAPRVVEFA